MRHLVGQSELGDRGSRIATADDREGSTLGDSFGDGTGAGNESRILEHAHRAVPEDHPGLTDDVAELRGRSGSDVQAHPAVGQRATEVAHVTTGGRITDLAAGAQTHHVGRQMQAVAVLGEQRSAAVDLVGLAQRVADLVTHRGEEREAHAPADDDRVRDLQQCGQHAELVGHLRPAGDRDERMLRVLTQTQQYLDLCRQQPTRGRGQPRGRTDDRGVGTVRRTEGVVDVQIVAGDETVDERRVVRGLAGIEAQVVEKFHTRSELGQALANRFDGESRIRCALRTTQMGAGGDRRTVLDQPVDGG